MPIITPLESGRQETAQAPEKVYRGECGHAVYVDRRGDGVTHTHPLRHRVRHSPDGFSWGYYGSGPADLALSMLWDYLGTEPPPDTYQLFKEDVIATLEGDWRITSGEISAWIAKRAEENGPSRPTPVNLLAPRPTTPTRAPTTDRAVWRVRCDVCGFYEGGIADLRHARMFAAVHNGETGHPTAVVTLIEVEVDVVRGKLDDPRRSE